MISIGSAAGNPFGIALSSDKASTPAKQGLTGIGQQSHDLPPEIRAALMTDADRLAELDSKLSELPKPLSVSQGSLLHLSADVLRYLAKAA